MILLGFTKKQIETIANTQGINLDAFVQTIVTEFEIVLDRYNRAIGENLRPVQFTNVLLSDDGITADIDIALLPNAVKACNVLKQNGTDIGVVFEVLYSKSTKDLPLFKSYEHWQTAQIEKFIHSLVVAGFATLLGLPLKPDTVDAWTIHCSLKANFNIA